MEEFEVKKLFGKRVKELRFNKKLTQEKLSELILMDPQHYCKMENGNHFPSLKNIIKLAQALDVEIHELFTFELSPKNKKLEKIYHQLNKLSPNELNFVENIIISVKELRAE